MRKIQIVLFILITSLFFTGCNSESGAGFTKTSSNIDDTVNTDGTVEIVSCTDSMDDWTTLLSGDVVKAQPDAQLKFDQDSDSVKKVCLLSGEATIQRGN